MRWKWRTNETKGGELKEELVCSVYQPEESEGEFESMSLHVCDVLHFKYRFHPKKRPTEKEIKINYFHPASSRGSLSIVTLYTNSAVTRFAF
jgi:hypothetical protein